MCGLVGVVGDVTGKEESIFKHLLVLDSCRGEHSTGAVFVPTNGDPFIAKQVGNPWELFNDRRFEEGLRRKNKALIGHNRFATQGAVNRKNAHPFNFLDVYGAHNGTLTQRYKLDKNSDFDVDSMSLYHHIAHKGIEDAISKVQGAWALTWWDDAESEMCFLRNPDRPLWMAWSENNRTMFWASERWMLDVALDRAGYKHNEPGQLKENLLLRIPVDNKGDMGEGVQKILEAPKFIPPVTTGKSTTTPTVGGAASNTATRFPQTSQGTSSTTQVGNVVNLQTKDQLTPLPTYCQSYLGTKGQIVEIVARHALSSTSEYLLCVDPMFPGPKFRIYVKAKEPFFIGEVVEADVMSFVNREGGYFILNGTTVKSVKFPEPQEETYTNHKGDELTKAEWEKAYPGCSWCTIDLVPGEAGNAFTRGGDCICPSCAADTTIQGFIAQTH